MIQYSQRHRIDWRLCEEDLFDFLQAAAYRESLLAVLVGRWFPGRLAEVKKISQTDDFQDPPGYFVETYEKYMNRLEDA